MVKIE